MSPLIAKIVTFGAIASVIALLTMSAGRTVLGAEAANTHQLTSATDFSARKKRHRIAVPFAVAPPRQYYGAANPNDGPGTAQLRQARQQHRCVIDEGYGRWTACSNE